MEVGNVYIDSVKSDQSEIVIEEIEINTESNFLVDDADEEDIFQVHVVSPNCPQISASDLENVDTIRYKEGNSLNLRHKVLSKPVMQNSSMLPAGKHDFCSLAFAQDLAISSSHLSANMIKKVIVLQPNDDPKVVTAKAVDEIMASLNEKAATDIAKNAQPSEETIVEIISIKTGGDLKSKEILKTVANSQPVAIQKAIASSREPIILKESFRRELDSPSYRFSYSKIRTPSPVSRGERMWVGMTDLENVSADCYFNSQLLSVRLASPDQTELKSVENRITDSKNHKNCGTQECSHVYHLKKTVKDKEKSEHDISITSNRISEQMQLDIDPTEPPANARRSVNLMSGTLQPLCLVQNQLSTNKVNDHEKERDKRPPYSYVQLIQMALFTKTDQRMTLREIYEWIENRFPYYKHHKNPGWKNSIRHSLSLSDIFVRKKTGHNGRSGNAYWTLDLAKLSEKRDGFASLMFIHEKNSLGNAVRIAETSGQGVFEMSASNSAEITVGTFLQTNSSVSSILEFSSLNDVSIMPYEETIDQNQTILLTKQLSKKRGSAAEIRHQNKRQKYSTDSELIGSSVGDATSLLNISILGQRSVCDVEQLCSNEDGTGATFARQEMSADSTSERPATVTCASELLCWSDRRTFATKSLGLPKPKIYRHHRRKQDLRVLRTPSETDGINEISKLDGAVSESTLMTTERELGDASEDIAICLVKTPNKADSLHTPKDEEDINHMLFTPFKSSGGAPPYLSWVSPVHDLSPISLNPSLLLTPSGLDSTWAVGGLDGVRGATTPCQMIGGTPYTTPIITKLLLDCLNGRASYADVNLDNRSFCSLLGDEAHEQGEDVDSDFISNLFPF